MRIKIEINKINIKNINLNGIISKEEVCSLNKKWMLRRNKLNIRDIANKSGISETLCTVLVNREIYDLEDIKDF